VAAREAVDPARILQVQAASRNDLRHEAHHRAQKGQSERLSRLIECRSDVYRTLGIRLSNAHLQEHQNDKKKTTQRAVTIHRTACLRSLSLGPTDCEAKGSQGVEQRAGVPGDMAP
jgi:hypothetical protein